MGSGLAPSARPGTTVSLLILALMGLARPSTPLVLGEAVNRGCPRQALGCPVRFLWTRCMAWILVGFERFAAFETPTGGHAMLHQNSVFHGLLKYVPWNRLEQIVEMHGA